MDCGDEVALIERRFKNLPGLEDFSADLLGQRLHVKYDAAKVSASHIAAAVADAGMRASLEHEEPSPSGSIRFRTRQVLLAASGVSLAAGLLVQMRGAPSGLSIALFVLSIAASVPLNIRRTIHALRLRSLDINVLMSIAVIGAIALGEWSEAAAVVFLFAVAQALESRTLERARSAVRELMELTPAEALMRDGADEIRVAADAVPLGALIVIKPNERIPLDGEIVSGTSAINQAPVTGESVPVDRGPGDEVFAGTINGHGALEVRVIKHRRDTTLARIIHLVERAQAQRAPAQTFVERFARVYTPTVIALAVLLAFAPPLLLGAAWETWIYRALVLLVVSCPCALVISTPVSIAAALAGAARHGVLVKGGVHLERAARIRCVAFDKTGTLTYGQPEVVEVISLGDCPVDELVTLAASIEQRSEHPIARAIGRYAATRAPIVAARDVASIGGRGVAGLVGESRVLLGNQRLFDEQHLSTPACLPHLKRLSAKGLTAVFVAVDGRTVGVIAVADRPRKGASQAITRLRQQGIASVAMLTGDSAATARAIAAELGVDDVSAEMMPQDKVDAVSELRRRHGPVAMVGDGVNDAPALASADVGIAMGAAGSDATLETADIALMADDLEKVPYALRLSQSTVRNIKTNLAISLVMKAGFVVAAAAGVATLWIAIVADTGASVVVIANALRLLRAD